MLVVKIQRHIGADHYEVEHVEKHYVPDNVAAHNLAQDSADVTKINQNKKQKALALG
jgi:hypothetical protein